jgi:hypothetical protein
VNQLKGEKAKNVQRKRQIDNKEQKESMTEGKSKKGD